MKNYLVFGGDYYYPCGGWEDYQDSFDTYEEAEALATKLVEGKKKNVRRYIFFDSRCDWTHIVDGATGIMLNSFTKEQR